MQIAAAFVEYLVTGCGALLWMALVAGVSERGFSALTAQQVALALPVIYVVGMFIDGIASLLLRRAKPWVRREKPGAAEVENQERTAFIALYSGDLSRELQVRSSRDRIARGALFNIVLFGAIATIFPERLAALVGSGTPSRIPVALATVLLAAVAFVLWGHYEYYTHQFKLQALKAIEQKLKAAAGPDHGAREPKTGSKK